jgi:hypothetical protein
VISGVVLDERKRRIGENEGRFRRVNELVRPLDETVMTILCECGSGTCREHLVIAREEYARVREEATLFILRPGHDEPGAETVVSKNLEFWIVRKHAGLPARIALATDPSSKREDLTSRGDLSLS